MKNKGIYLLLVSIFMCCFSYAQDMIYDLTYANRLNMNPAFSGNDGSGKIRASAFHHNQYMNNRGPFHISSAAIDYGICDLRLNVGMLLQNETQGDGFLSTNSIGVIVGTIRKIGKYSLLSAGMSYSIYNYSVDWDRYVFSDQLDPIKGIVNTSSNANAGLLSEFTQGLNLGINFTKWKIRGFKRNRDHAFNLGASYSHVFIRPRASLLNPSIQSPGRITIHSSLLLKKKHNLIDNAKEFTMRYDIQDLFSSMIIQGGIYMNEFVFMGVGLRSSFMSYEGLRNSVKPLLELRLYSRESGIQYNFCYGFNILDNATGMGHSIELGIVWVSQNNYCTDALSRVFGRKNKRNGVSSRKNGAKCPTFNDALIEVPRF